MRLRSFTIVLLSLLIFSPMASSSLEAAEKQPNFLVILCDDLGYGDLACFGHPHIKTPHLDKLASQGVKMTACYSSSPVCSPSRAGLLTGRTPNRTGVYDWIPEDHPVHLPRKEISLATILKTVGYETAHVGKWHCNGFFNNEKHPQPNDHGFDHWYSTQNNASPSHENPKNYVRNGKEVGEEKGFACQLTATEGINWLKGRKDSTKPFFLHVCFHEPHEPVASPKAMVDKYMSVAKTRDEAQYFANVENMDAAVGRLMATLDELKLDKNTLVYFTSDNGPETLNRYRTANRSYGSPGPLRGMKLHIYEGGIRVPGIVRMTGKIPEGVEHDEPICALDLFPTFCTLSGAKQPTDREYDGTDLTPLVQGQDLIRDKPLFWHYYRSKSKPCVAMRDGDWKIVAYWDAPWIYGTRGMAYSNVSKEVVDYIKSAKLVDFELYNLSNDLKETTDLAKSHPEKLDEMKKKVVAKYLEVQKESPVWSDEELESYKKIQMQRVQERRRLLEQKRKEKAKVK